VTSQKNLEELESIGFTVHDMNLRRASTNPFAELKLITQKYKIVKSVKPDLVHLVTIKPAVYGGFILKFLKVPSIASLVGLGIVSSKDKNDFLLNSLIKLLLKTTISKTVVFENSADRDVIKQLGTNSRLVVIDGAGVDLDKFNYEPQVEREVVKVLFASRLLWKKGLKQLVDACDKLSSDGHNIELHVAGISDSDSEDAIPLNVIEQWSEAGKIIWHGNVGNMPELISECDIVCLPTTYGEGVPRILIEAAACGRAIIATDIPGCRDIVSDNENGYLYALENGSGLYQTLEKALQNKSKWTEMGLRGRELVKNRFSNDVVIKQWLDVYSSVIEKV
jgi:glycosyltransferase involved in cell wall biosynthesis